MYELHPPCLRTIPRLVREPKKVLSLAPDAQQRLADGVGRGLIDPRGCWQASELPGVLPP
jgi:hypothetical protein